MNRTKTIISSKATRLFVTTLGFACLAAIGLHYGHAGAAEAAVSAYSVIASSFHKHL